MGLSDRRMETAIMSTVGGRVKTRTLPVYECRVKNLMGKTKVFHAMGLERITGYMSCPLSGAQLRVLFPGHKYVGSLAMSRRPVDYMIGMDQSSVVSGDLQ